MNNKQNQDLSKKNQKKEKAIDFDRDKNTSYQPQDEAYGDGFEPLEKNAKNPSGPRPDPDADPYENPLDDNQNRQPSDRELPNAKKEKAWMQTNEGVNTVSEEEEFQDDFQVTKATEVNQSRQQKNESTKH